MTELHGFHEEIFCDAGSFLLVVFHGLGDPMRLVPHVLYLVFPGCWRSSAGWEVWLDLSFLHAPSHPLPSTTMTLTEGLPVKHTMMWLHPRRAPQSLFLLQENRIVWSDGTRVSPANGYYSYGEDADAPGMDLWLVHYHCEGIDAMAQTTVLKRVVREHNIWRAVGSVTVDFALQYREFSCRDLKQWHILMIGMEGAVQ